MLRQRLDTKQEPKYTETNKTGGHNETNETQVKTIRQGNTRAGKTKKQGGTAVAVTLTVSNWKKL